MRFVPVKSDDQLDLQSLHRVRERWVMRRTAVSTKFADYCSSVARRCAKAGATWMKHCPDTRKKLVQAFGAVLVYSQNSSRNWSN